MSYKPLKLLHFFGTPCSLENLTIDRSVVSYQHCSKYKYTAICKKCDILLIYRCPNKSDSVLLKIFGLGNQLRYLWDAETCGYLAR